MTAPGTLAGKVFFATGANSGLGLATALCFAREGAAVAILARRAAANATAREAIEALGVPCLTIDGDATDEPTMCDAVKAIVRRFGTLHYGFNCAGAAQSVTPLVKVRIDEYQRLMDANVRSTFLGLKHMIPAIKAAGGGAICNCASTAGLIPSAQQVIYAAAKFAIIGMTRGAALEAAADGVRINVICPGATSGRGDRP